MAKVLSDELAAVVQDVARAFLRSEIPTIRRLIQGRLVDNWQGSLFLVKGTSNVTAPAAGSFNVYGKLGEAQGSETDIGDDVTVYVRMGDYTANKWGIAAPVGSGFEMLITECAT